MNIKHKSVKAKTPASKAPAKKQERPKSTPQLGSFVKQQTGEEVPMLILNPESRFPFQFGVPKAKMILEHLDTIRAFAESNGESIE
jgi:hypothetical protein